MPLTKSDIEAARARRRRQPSFRQVDVQQNITPESVEAERSGGGLLGNFADAFRSVVPRGVRDVVGTGIQTGLSGERFINAVLPGDPGTAIRNKIEDIPDFQFFGVGPNIDAGGVLGEAFDIASSPLTLATAGLGGSAQAALRGPGLIRGAARFATAPITRGGFGTRLGAETTAELAGTAASRELSERGAPLPLALAAGLVGGVGGAVGFRGAQNAARRFAEATANVPIGASVRDVSGDQTFDDAADVLRQRLDEQAQGRRTGATEQQISQGRGEGFGRQRDVIEDAAPGQSAEQLSDAARAAGRGGLTSQDPLLVSPTNREELYTQLNEALRSDELTEPQWNTLKGALDRTMRGGTELQPEELRLMDEFFFGAAEGVIPAGPSGAVGAAKRSIASRSSQSKGVRPLRKGSSVPSPARSTGDPTRPSQAKRDLERARTARAQDEAQRLRDERAGRKAADAELATSRRKGAPSPRKRATASSVDTTLKRQSPPKSSGKRQAEARRAAREANASVKGTERHLADKLLDASRIQGSLLTAFDASYPFRQGLVLFRRAAWWESWEPMYRAFFSDEAARRIDDETWRGRSGEIATEKGLDHVPIDLEDVPLPLRPEEFQSTFAERIPVIGELVKASQRGFTTFGNVVRKRSFDRWLADVDNRLALGHITRAQWDETLEHQARWLNSASGRANISKELAQSRFMVAVNLGVFSFRLQKSRWEVLAGAFNVASGRPMPVGARQEMARDLVGFVGAGVGALTMGAMFLDLDVELDPRSPDFGKARIGDTRIDPWGGFQQYARLIHGMSLAVSNGLRTGDFDVESKAITSGDVWDQSMRERLMRFGRSKASPFASIFIDTISGRLFTGEEVDVTDIGQDARRIVPLSIQDLWDAVREDGLVGGIAATPSLVGFGVSSFETRADVREKGAQELFGSSFHDLTGQRQQDVEDRFRDEIRNAGTRSDSEEAFDNIRTETMDEERKLIAALDEGADPGAVTSALDKLNLQRIARQQQTASDFGFDREPDENDPVRRIFDLREKAEQFGFVDFQLLDEFQAAELASMTADERRQWDERRRFRHDPVAQVIFDAKDTIADAGYWDARTESYERFEAQIIRLEPSIQSYMQLEFAIRRAELDGDNGRKRRLNGIKTRIDKLTKQKRRRLRLRDADLDAALGRVYGSTPIRQQR